MMFCSSLGSATVLALGFILAAFMYNRNRKEGIDTSKVFTEIPPAQEARRKVSLRRSRGRGPRFLTKGEYA